MRRVKRARGARRARPPSGSSAASPPCLDPPVYQSFQLPSEIFNLQWWPAAVGKHRWGNHKKELTLPHHHHRIHSCHMGLSSQSFLPPTRAPRIQRNHLMKAPRIPLTLLQWLLRNQRNHLRREPHSLLTELRSWWTEPRIRLKEPYNLLTQSCLLLLHGSKNPFLSRCLLLSLERPRISKLTSPD